MGNRFYRPIFYYYGFQKKIKDQINNNKKDNENEDEGVKTGYLVSPEWIKEFRKRINYSEIEKKLDTYKNIDFSNISKIEKIQIKTELKRNNINSIDFYNIVKSKPFFLNKILSIKNLQIFLDKQTFELFKIEKTFNIQIEYIFKEKMIIFFFKNNCRIKILINNLSPISEEKKLVNLTFYLVNIANYDKYYNIFTTKSSDEILFMFKNYDNLGKRKYFIDENNSRITLINEELDKEYKDNNILDIKIRNSEKKEEEKNLDGIKNPKDIKFELIANVSFRGLENVGATCYMNATLQCLANIRPITEYLLNKENYTYLFDNFDLCQLTLQYIQVLDGLYCNASPKGSYKPEEFKKSISELNPLFQGVQANDSKDLIIFLLEEWNNELIKIHNKKNNIIEDENGPYPKIDISNQAKVFENFLNNFKKTHCSIIGEYLIGFNKSVFLCQNCNKMTINFNLYNILIFSLEATSNYFNLSYNNSTVPTINFDFCFKYMAKEELFQDTYCAHCRKTGLSKYRETIYTLPQYLIIILNRGRGNIFNCIVPIPEIFDASNYIEIKSQNNNYELVGIVSHFGESGISGHFIAFCKHNRDGKWRCYNDSVVTECQNDYLNKGTPYIVFYKKCQTENNNINTFQNSQEINNGNNNSNQNQNINHNFCNNNMQINNISNNNNINQNMNIISTNNNYNELNVMMMNNINNYNQNYNNNFQQNIVNNNNNQQNMIYNNNQQNMIYNNNQQNIVNNNNNQQNIVNNNNFQQNMIYNNNQQNMIYNNNQQNMMIMNNIINNNQNAFMNNQQNNNININMNMNLQSM